MQVRKCWFVVALLLTAAGCSSGNTLRKADCYDCTTENQEWKKFAWDDLIGTWRGNLETMTDDISAKKKQRQVKSAEVRFVDGADFLTTLAVKDCGKFPQHAVVLNGALYEATEKDSRNNTYEIFGETANQEVSYGRATISKVNGANICTYEKIGPVMGMNRLALPAMHLSQRLTPNGRTLASGPTPEFQLSFEFLNFEPGKAVAQKVDKGSRKPAAISAQDSPPLMFRVFKIVNSVKSAFDEGQWQSTEEHLYRLWRVQ